MNRLMRWGALAATGLALTACGGGDEGTAPAANADTEVADKLAPGTYIIRAQVNALDVTQGDKAASVLKLGDKTEVKVCVGDDGVIPAAGFAETGDNCFAESPYAKRGKLRMALRCIRPGKGEVGVQVQGQIEGPGMVGEISSNSYLFGGGDYRMTRSFSASPAGACEG